VLARSMARYLVAQAKAGADALMLFDSWVGLLDDASYRRIVLPVMKPVIARIQAETSRPVIYFAHGAAMLLESVAELGADVVGIDWTVPLSSAVDRLGTDAVVQGNLDPSALFAPPAELQREIDSVLEQGTAARGHVFNLGHGIHRTTDPDRVAFLVDRVHERSQRGREIPA
ncbi:MAG: uroporphyrinogen decarboxylase family protein, partial [Gemmatimonadales bacterium]